MVLRTLLRSMQIVRKTHVKTLVKWDDIVNPVRCFNGPHCLDHDVIAISGKRTLPVLISVEFGGPVTQRMHVICLAFLTDGLEKEDICVVHMRTTECQAKPTGVRHAQLKSHFLIGVADLEIELIFKAEGFTGVGTCLRESEQERGGLHINGW